MKKTLFFSGLLVTLSPVLATIFGFLYCAISPSNICLAVPFAWMLMWPAYILGIVVVSASALLSEDRKPSPAKIESVTGYQSQHEKGGWSKKIVPMLFIVFASFIFINIAIKQSALKSERSLVLRFVEEKSKVKSAAGIAFKVFPESEVVRDGYPTRYIVSVSAKKVFFAVVDVARSWWRPNFSLACISYVEPKDRYPFQDECAQGQGR